MLPSKTWQLIGRGSREPLKLLEHRSDFRNINMATRRRIDHRGRSLGIGILIEETAIIVQKKSDESLYWGD